MKLFYLALLTLPIPLWGQPNCEVFRYNGDSLKYKACKKSEEAGNYYQFSREFQEILDEALAIDSTFAYAYREKSVAYLKSGDFLTWKTLMDQAVAYDPKGNLGYRGWCRYQFFRDYQGAIADIERLDSLTNYDIGYSANGDYHLHFARAICYQAIGKQQKALAIIDSLLSSEEYNVGVYDYLHLGALRLALGDYEPAVQAFRKQEVLNDLAENQYYLALVYKAMKRTEPYLSHLAKAQEMYKQGRIMKDTYTHQYNKVYLSDIEDELKVAHWLHNEERADALRD